MSKKSSKTPIVKNIIEKDDNESSSDEDGEEELSEDEDFVNEAPIKEIINVKKGKKNIKKNDDDEEDDEDEEIDEEENDDEEKEEDEDEVEEDEEKVKSKKVKKIADDGDENEINDENLEMLEDDDDEIDLENIFKEDIITFSKTRISKKFVTKYEKVNLLCTRTKQLSQGAKPMIKNTAGLSYRDIAKLEFQEKTIPLKIVREIPNAPSEIWLLSELEFNE